MPEPIDLTQENVPTRAQKPGPSKWYPARETRWPTDQLEGQHVEVQCRPRVYTPTLSARSDAGVGTSDGTPSSKRLRREDSSLSPNQNRSLSNSIPHDSERVQEYEVCMDEAETARKSSTVHSKLCYRTLPLMLPSDLEGENTIAKLQARPKRRIVVSHRICASCRYPGLSCGACRENEDQCQHGDQCPGPCSSCALFKRDCIFEQPLATDTRAEEHRLMGEGREGSRTERHVEATMPEQAPEKAMGTLRRHLHELETSLLAAATAARRMQEDLG